MKNKKDPVQNLFVFDLANNHMGNVKHGLKIIREIYKVTREFDFRFGFKLQYRNLNTFIHPDFKGRTDIKYIKRFSETKLDETELKTLKDEIDNLGFIPICTPFDEKSVELIEKHSFEIIKIASCSFTDWPLLERIAESEKPIIASTAGASWTEIDNVVNFFEHREKNLTLMHCVAEYPTLDSNLQLGQIDLLKFRYPQIRIGYSTHENPDNLNAVQIAIAKGATVFERHVGIETKEFGLNDYSARPEQIHKWLKSADDAIKICGLTRSRYKTSQKELSNLMALRRGVFAKQNIGKGQNIEMADVFFVIPNNEGQITANDMSKYTHFLAKKDIDANQPVLSKDIDKVDVREKVYQIVQQVKGILKRSNVVVTGKSDLEISHHYGIDLFYQYGATIINLVNREYCKKLIALLPGQKHPEQYHKLKEETFHILYGDVTLTLNGVETECHKGDIVTVERGTIHAFSSKEGAVVEEISSTHYTDDSFYTDPEISNNMSRKTLLSYWLD